MIRWKKFNLTHPPSDGQYLVTDGKCVEVASLQDFKDGEGADLFLPERTQINGKEAVTHYARINLPESN